MGRLHLALEGLEANSGFPGGGSTSRMLEKMARKEAKSAECRTGSKMAAAACFPSRASSRSSMAGSGFPCCLYKGLGTWNFWGQLKIALIARSSLF